MVKEEKSWADMTQEELKRAFMHVKKKQEAHFRNAKSNGQPQKHIVPPGD